MTYDDWKLETPEDEQLRFEAETRAWTRRLYGRPAYWTNDRQEVLDDYYEAEKADADMDREDDEEE